MNYIYPITDPKILKLGIRMALYGEKKPEMGIVYNPLEEGTQSEYEENYEAWQKSRIVYLKKPEFKVGDEVSNIDSETWLDTRFTIEEIEGNEIKCLDDSSFPTYHYFNVDYISHYIPGQEVESFKYVKEVSIKISKTTPEIGNSTLYQEDRVYAFEWQEVEEPEEALIDYSRITGGEVTQELSTNPKYTQFQADKDEAKILVVIECKK